MANNFQQPLFTSNNQGQDADFDLNEIFADYFNDDYLPSIGIDHNVYQQHQPQKQVHVPSQQQQKQQQWHQQPNYNQHQQQQQQYSQSLPTGRGIQTPFHSNTSGVPQQVNKRPRVESKQHLAPPQAQGQNMGIHMYNGVIQQQHNANQQQVPMQHNQYRAPAQVPANTAGSGLSERLGFLQQQQQQQFMFPKQQNAGSGSGVQDQAAERRERNREHAKRSRVRKKFLLESLQEQVRSLQRENASLRLLIQSKLPDKAQDIISKCCKEVSFEKKTELSTLITDASGTPATAPSKLKSAEGEDEKESNQDLLRSDFNLIKSISGSQANFVLSDPRLPDNPIVYASPGFYELTGYTRERVLGRNCRFLQGPGTDPKHVQMIRDAVSKGNDFSICILNYRADGTPFWNQLFLAALRDSDNCIVNYVGVQCAVDLELENTLLEDKVNTILPLAMKEDEEKNEMQAQQPHQMPAVPSQQGS